MNEEYQNINAILAQMTQNGPITYRDYIDCALYHPDCGYYCAERTRVGRTPGTDFYTAESLGAVYAELIVCGAQEILCQDANTELDAEFDVSAYTFVEIAAEPNSGIISQLPNGTHPFAAAKTLRYGDPLEVSGPVVIFANEWLDALPFHRLRFSKGKWRERGVIWTDNGLQEVQFDVLSPDVAKEAHRLPKDAPEGYCFDWSLEAEKALSNLLAQNWHGILLLFDYGKSWADLLENCPSGSARTYYRHEIGSDLLKNASEADITCDVCWSPLQSICKKFCESVVLESQEAFFVQRGHRVAESIVLESAGQFSPRRQTLMELIHPAHMGRKFQVLWAKRNP